MPSKQSSLTSRQNSPPSAATRLSHAGQTWRGSRRCIQTCRSAPPGRTRTWCGPFFSPSWLLWRPVSGKRCRGSSPPSVSVGNVAMVHINYNRVVQSLSPFLLVSPTGTYFKTVHLHFLKLSRDGCSSTVHKHINRPQLLLCLNDKKTLL